MRIKFFAIYILAGAAFLGVSLWVFLSNGKNARALRAKYKLGGMMLTAWTMFSSAACEGVAPQVMCYDTPAPEVTCYEPAIMSDEASIHVQGNDNLEIRSGGILEVHIMYPTFDQYKCSIYAGETTEAALIQEFEYAVPKDAGSVDFTLELAATKYKGKATVLLQGTHSTPDSSHQSEWEPLPVGLPLLNIL